LALRRTQMLACAKQDALRSFSEEGPVHYVYLIESRSSRGERYVRTTTDLKQRLQEHNRGKSSHTSKFRPWKLTTYIAFRGRGKAEAFERLDQATHSPTSAYGSCTAVLLRVILRFRRTLCETAVSR